MTTGIPAQSIVKAFRLLRAAILSPTSGWLSKLALALGVAYLFVPIDLISDHIPIIGHADEAGFLVFGLIFSYLLIPSDLGDKIRGDTLHIPSPVSPSGTPNFFIVGAPRCGTTSLFEALSQHPDVFCCPVKEPNYFAFEASERDAALEHARSQGLLIERGLSRLLAPPMVAVVGGYETYLALFRGWSGQRAVGEASTSYLSSSAAASAIAAYCPDAKIIIVLRDPVARAYSDYLMLRQLGQALGSFDAAVRREMLEIRDGHSCGRGIIRSSCYAGQIRQYLEHFPRRQLLFVLFEELVRQPEVTLQRVFRHLDVAPVAGEHVRITWRNKSQSARVDWINRALFRTGKKWLLLRLVPKPVRRWLGRIYYAADRPPPLSVHDREWLCDLFRADIQQTSALIDRDLTHWAAGIGTAASGR